MPARRRAGLVARPAPAPAAPAAITLPVSAGVSLPAVVTTQPIEKRKVIIVGEYVRQDGKLEPAVSKSLGIGALVLIGSILFAGLAFFLLVLVSWGGAYAAHSLLMSIAK